MHYNLKWTKQPSDSIVIPTPAVAANAHDCNFGTAEPSEFVGVSN